MYLSASSRLILPVVFGARLKMVSSAVGGIAVENTVILVVVAVSVALVEAA